MQPEFLLDTNVVSELRKGPAANPGVLLWKSGVADGWTCLSVITLMELQKGMLLLRRYDPTQAEVLDRWIRTRVLVSFGGRLMPITPEIALRTASLHVPNPIDDADGYIAGTALVHDLTVVTRNARDFSRTGARWLNPWS